MYSTMLYKVNDKVVHFKNFWYERSMAKKMVMIRMDEQIKAFFKEHADKERRSLSNFIINSTIEYIRAEYDKELEPKKSKK